LTESIFEKADGAWKLDVLFKFIENDDANYVEERLQTCENYIE
jgi:hypothetical protein